MTFIQINLAEMKILVVDDSSTARKILSEMLREIGVGHVIGAEDGAEAIERLRTFPADIMLCDLHMAPLDGIELTRLIRNASDSPNPYLPIIMLTADATQAQMKNAFNAGVNGFMSKPVKMNVLHRKLYAIFSHPLVFIRDGRALRPLQAVQASHVPAGAQQPTTTTPPDPDKAPVESSEPDCNTDGPDSCGPRPLTRRDLGFA
jgi:two-component system, chemotaxis family, chemotaxis protein CheY